MIERSICKTLRRVGSEFPVLSLTGPRQSGKTTISREFFSDYEYVSLENPENYNLAQEDATVFLNLHPGPVILDEAQKCPKLFSYLQGIVDESNQPGKYVLTGSQNFLLMKTISQSLAGRVGVTYLLPLEYDELKLAGIEAEYLEDAIFTGFYPRIFDQNITPHDFYLSYLRTFVERDVKDELGVRKTTDFRKNLTLCASRIGNLLDISNLAKASAISVGTINSWISLLQTSFVVFLLQPYSQNFGKRIIKTPKIYFVDTGLACHLLGISGGRQILENSDLRGKLFENFVIAELIKKYYNRGMEPCLYFWRDTNGREIDLIIEHGGKIAYAVEIKSSGTMDLKYFKNLNSLGEIMNLEPEQKIVVYGGQTSVQTKFGRFLTVGELDDLVV